MSTINDTQKRHLDSLVRSSAFQFSDKYFTYDSGEIGPYLFDTAAILEEGALWGEICRDIVTDLKQKQGLEFDVIAGGKSMGGKSMGWMFSGMVSVMLEKPYITIYKDKSTRGASVENKNVLFIGDYLHAGSNIRKVWQPAIQEQKGKLIGTYFYMDKNEGGKEAIENLGLQSHSLLKLNNESWEYILKEANLSPEEHKTMQKYRKDKGLWVKENLTQILNHQFEMSPEQKRILKAYSDIAKEIKKGLYEEKDLQEGYGYH